MKIEKLDLCNGCTKCFSICPKSAISMEPNSEGFLYPVIDKSKCILCSKCEKICPIINKKEIKDENTQAFAVINNDEKIRLQSSSGGVFTALANFILIKNGVVFGVKLDSEFKAVFSYTESLKGLEDFRGSKYVQAEVGEAYKQCKAFLEEDRLVLFSGTPCQIGGLYAFLGKKYEKLLCVDLICQGVPSPLFWKKYLEYNEKKNKSKVENVSFRNKDYGWKQFSLSLKYNNGKKCISKLKENKYLKIFLRDYGLKNSCYDCSYKKINCNADITIADFWGIQNEYPDLDDDKGTSFVITHTLKGSEILSKFENCNIKNININQGLKNNPSMIKSVSKPRKRDLFFIGLEKKYKICIK